MSEIPLQPVPYYSGPPPMPFAGRRTGSRTFGVIAIVLGSLSGCMVMVMPLALLVSRSASNPGIRPEQMISGALIWLGGAGALIWFGTGAFRLRRWAGPLAITGGTLWLLSGVIGTIALACTLPQTRAAMRQGPGAPSLPPGFEWIVFGFTIAMGLVFGIVLPALYVWFYNKPETGAMLDYYDPRPRWTDGCPLPVLGLTVALATLGISRLLTAPAAIDAVFGVVLFGLPAAGLMLLEGAVMTVLARLAFLRRPAGWWGSLALAIIWTASSVAMLAHPQTARMYHHAGFSDRQIAAMTGGGARAAQWAAGIPSILLAFGYLFYVRRFFVAAAKGAPIAAA